MDKICQRKVERSGKGEREGQLSNHNGGGEKNSLCHVCTMLLICHMNVLNLPQCLHPLLETPSSVQIMCIPCGLNLSADFLLSPCRSLREKFAKPHVDYSCFTKNITFLFDSCTLIKSTDTISTNLVCPGPQVTSQGPYTVQCRRELEA